MCYFASDKHSVVLHSTQNIFILLYVRITAYWVLQHFIYSFHWLCISAWHLLLPGLSAYSEMKVWPSSQNKKVVSCNKSFIEIYSYIHKNTFYHLFPPVCFDKFHTNDYFSHNQFQGECKYSWIHLTNINLLGFYSHNMESLMHLL